MKIKNINYKIEHPNLLGAILIFAAKFLIWLRYKKCIDGLKEIKQKGKSGILFLPNHPALIDPVIMMTILYKDFAPVAIADELQIDRPVIRWLSEFFGVKTIPNLEKRGLEYAGDRKKILEDIAHLLKNGSNILLYPAGHIKRSRFEKIGASSGVETILKFVPDTRVVIVRQNGLWGSSFSFAFNGNPPQVGKSLLRGLKFILLNAIFFTPCRKIEYEFTEHSDFPRDKGRMEINSYLENYYNDNAWQNRFVPYLFWEKGSARNLPEPKPRGIKEDTSQIPTATKKIVMDKLKEISGVEDIQPDSIINYDLGMDSLNMSELVVWLKDEFGFSISSPETLITVNDVFIAAMGRGISAGEIEFTPPRRKWFRSKKKGKAFACDGETLTEVFIKKASSRLSQVIFADQLSGEKTYREVIRYILIIKPFIETMDGEYVGIMMPASVMASVLYYAVLFSGKTPVMVNWTTGPRTVNQSLNILGVNKVITSKVMVSRVENQGITLDEIKEKFVYLEDVKGKITFGAKLNGFLKSHIGWKHILNVKPAKNAVVLFTSGSETLPKAVALTHKNILSNIRDITGFIELKENDSLVGILPAFHSFGLTVTVILPAVIGIRVVYHSNPTESAHIARVIDGYHTSILLGTPTFLNGILRAADYIQLKSLRLAVTGAEKCPDHVYRRLAEISPNLTVLEGYGVTECSPIISVNPPDAPRAGTIGRVLGFYRYALIDPESGEKAGFNQNGLLIVRGPSVFSGYLNYGGESPFIELDGFKWYTTGDLVSESQDGYLTFKGRLKRFVKIGSEMISLPAIESVLQPYFSVPDDEKPQIAVEATADQENPEIVLFCAIHVDRQKANRIIRQSGLSPLHNIRKVIPIDSIPLLGNGKTDYRKLKDILRHHA